MSAPDTNVEKQEKKHKAPLGGMALVVGFALVLLVLLVFFVFGNGEEPAGSEIVVGAGGETTAVSE